MLRDDLQRLLSKQPQRVVFVVGTGVALSALKGAACEPLASWVGLLRHGLQHACGIGEFDSEQLVDYERLLVRPQTHNLIHVAGLVEHHLQKPGGEFRRWLRETVGQFVPQIRDHALLDVLAAHQQRGVLLATTNYDLLLEHATNLPTATWRDTATVDRALREPDDPHVLHLHGVWNQPASVVLGIKSYEDVVRDEYAQSVLRSLRTNYTFVFVGCGTGLNDPNIGGFLQWTAGVFHESEYRHYRLCRESETATVRGEHPRGQRILPLSYGENYSDLIPFLRSLVPTPRARAPFNPLSTVHESGCAEYPAPSEVDAAPEESTLHTTDTAPPTIDTSTSSEANGGAQEKSPPSAGEAFPTWLWLLLAAIGASGATFIVLVLARKVSGSECETDEGNEMHGLVPVAPWDLVPRGEPLVVIGRAGSIPSQEGMTTITPIAPQGEPAMAINWAESTRSGEGMIATDAPQKIAPTHAEIDKMTIARDFQAYLQSLNSAKFKHLYANQAEVLSLYSASFTKHKDVAVELPTGAGKTPIALLIANAWREAGKKVAVLSANKTLARQMASEADALGVPNAYMEGSSDSISSASIRDYQRGRRIGIMNYWVYFNQKQALDPADLLVMDDAHLAEHCLHSLYSVEINKYQHRELFVELVEVLRAGFPEYAILEDALSATAPPSSTAELLSFIDQEWIVSRAKGIIDLHTASEECERDLRFRWRRLRPKIREFNFYMSQNALWLRPYVYPLSANQHYARTEQALYMSATVGDAGDLARRLGTRPISKVPVSVSLRTKTSGRRFIVMNRKSDEERMSGKMAAALLAAIRKHPKSLWLCNSESDARKASEALGPWLEEYGISGHPVWILTPMGDEIDQFRRAPSGHLFVAGRFDGMDFKDDECRVVVLYALPRAINLQEEFITAYLGEAGFMRRRLNQRIVQALGRCNRAPLDFGIYFLADQRFAAHFAREENREGISPDMQAELDLAEDVAEMPEEDVVARVENFLEGEFTKYDRELAQRMQDVPAPRAARVTSDTSADEVLGWLALERLDYPEAEARFAKCAGAAQKDGLLELAALHKWHSAKALYLQGRSGDEAALTQALTALDEAIKLGNNSAWFNRLRQSILRAKRVPAM